MTAPLANLEGRRRAGWLTGSLAPVALGPARRIWAAARGTGGEEALTVVGGRGCNSGGVDSQVDQLFGGGGRKRNRWGEV